MTPQKGNMRAVKVVENVVDTFTHAGSFKRCALKVETGRVRAVESLTIMWTRTLVFETVCTFVV